MSECYNIIAKACHYKISNLKRLEISLDKWNAGRVSPLGSQLIRSEFDGFGEKKNYAYFACGFQSWQDARNLESSEFAAIGGMPGHIF